MVRILPSTHRMGSRRRGAALLEFALTLPLFLMLLLGIMEFATVFFVRHAMLHAAGEAARSYAIGESGETEAEQLALDQLAGVPAEFSATASPEGDAGLERWVEVSVPVDQASLGDPLSVMGGADLTVRVTMRREQ